MNNQGELELYSLASENTAKWSAMSAFLNSLFSTYG